MTKEDANLVFDYRALRLLVGAIAFLLPLVVTFLAADEELPSISYSYYTDARNAFVGMLFVVGAFLFAYNGHSMAEALASKGASVAAILIAVFPTSQDTPTLGQPSPVVTVHGLAAAALFIILTYFCFVPFRKRTKGKGGKKGLRSKIYLACGWVMIVSMVSALFANRVVEDIGPWGVLFWAEAIALGAFGVAWIVAGKYLRILAEDDEALYLLRR